MAWGPGSFCSLSRLTTAYFIVALLFSLYLRLVRGRPQPEDDVLAPGATLEDPGSATTL